MSENIDKKPPPTAIQTYNYAAGVRKDMLQLARDLKTCKNHRLVFQTLPKHMRRRAMSHHPNRLPRNKRAAHISQMCKTAPPKLTKRPARSYRRRPRQLMADYARRMRSHTWLETHLWHARRFKMVERWGYKLPYSSTQKTYRACYRASKDYCLLQDISYMCCLQLQGNLAKLLAGLATMTNDNCGAQTYLSGNRAGSLHLFRQHKYPFAAIARAQFMWRAAADEEGDHQRTLWLWVHPSVCSVLLEELVKVFELHNQKTSKVPVEPAAHYKEDKQQDLIYMTVTKLSNLQETVYMNEAKNVRLTVLKNKFNRFRLTGAKSFALLKSIFTPDAVELSHEKALNFWQSLCQDNTALQCLLPNSIIALTLKNAILPRAGEKLGYTDNLTASDDFQNLLQQRQDAQAYFPAGSGLWSQAVREQFTKNFIKAQRLQKRSAIPGKQLNVVDKNVQSMPVLLVQNVGAQRAQYKLLNYGAGWDIILPNGAGMPMWLAFIMRGARPGGLRETDTIQREMGIEEQLPDTLVGKRLAVERQLKEEQAYFKMPTNKRINYCAIGMRYAFRAPYEQLIKDWQGGNEFHVLRERQQLFLLEDCLKIALITGKFVALPAELSKAALIQVQVLCKRGMLSCNSLICLPLEQSSGKALKLDKFKAERLRLRKAHKSQLKRLRAQRVRQKRKLQETSDKRVQISPANTQELCNEYAQKMRNLCLPSTSFDESRPVMKLHEDTTVIGFVQTAQFSYTEHLVAGVGYIAVNGLEQLMRQLTESGEKELVVNVRERKTAVDRRALIKINLDV